MSEVDVGATTKSGPLGRGGSVRSRRRRGGPFLRMSSIVVCDVKIVCKAVLRPRDRGEMVARGGNVDGKVLGRIGITFDDVQESGLQFLAGICHEVSSGKSYSEVMQKKQQKGLKTSNPPVTRQPTTSEWWTRNGLGAS